LRGYSASLRQGKLYVLRVVKKAGREFGATAVMAGVGLLANRGWGAWQCTVGVRRGALDIKVVL